jgi:hypothetical protein
MTEDVGMTEEELLNVRDRPLTESYEVHDVGYDFLVRRLTRHDLLVVDHGDDNRHVDDVIYGDGPDLAVHQTGEDGGLGELLAYIEIKTKESPEWFGRCNERHFKEYVNFANEVDVPVFIWFALVDSEDERLLRDGFVRVETRDQIEGDVIEVSERAVVFDPEDTYEIDDGYKAVDGDDVVGVRPRDDIVEYIPNVHGNDVLCLNEDQLRSFPHFLHIVEGT